MTAEGRGSGIRNVKPKWAEQRVHPGAVRVACNFPVSYVRTPPSPHSQRFSGQISVLGMSPNSILKS